MKICSQKVVEISSLRIEFVAENGDRRGKPSEGEIEEGQSTQHEAQSLLLHRGLDMATKQRKMF